MGNVYFCSDLHDMHNAIGKYRSAQIPEVTSPETNREFIGDHWRAKKRDTVIMLGDIFFGADSHEFIGSLGGNKKLVPGNHDLENDSRTSLIDIMRVCSSIRGIYSKKYLGEKIWFSHVPMHPSELRGHPNMHGHIHNIWQDYMNKGTSHYNKNYINVNMDVLWPRTGQIMIDLEELPEYRKGFEGTFVYVVVRHHWQVDGNHYDDFQYFNSFEEAAKKNNPADPNCTFLKRQIEDAEHALNKFINGDSLDEFMKGNNVGTFPQAQLKLSEELLFGRKYDECQY